MPRGSGAAPERSPCGSAGSAGCRRRATAHGTPGDARTSLRAPTRTERAGQRLAGTLNGPPCPKTIKPVAGATGLVAAGLTNGVVVVLAAACATPVFGAGVVTAVLVMVSLLMPDSTPAEFLTLK